MLFNSYTYIAVFLPLTILVFYTLGQRSQRASVATLILASLIFYAWWRPTDLFWLCGSIILNFVAGSIIERWRARSASGAKWMLAGSVTANLLLLGYHKYLGFLGEMLWALLASGDRVEYVRETSALPLGISFFTFTQIAYLVDIYRRETERASFWDYALFVSYFPHVIAGPLLYHREMFPQFRRLPSRIDLENAAVGITVFSIGLFKKVILADGLAQHVSPLFDAAKVAGREISFAEGWIAAVGYTFQIYFDFSGYSDMAVGASIILGIRLPINFHSPYKVTNIIDFWRCWHVSLSRFLLHYVYVPLGGNRRGLFRRYSILWPR